MRRRIGFLAVFDIVDDVGCGEQDLRCEVAQGHVQDHWMVIEPRRVGDMGLGCDGGDNDEIAGPDQLLGSVVHGDVVAAAGLFQVTAKARRAVGGQIVHSDFVERPTGTVQEGVDVSGDQAHPEETRPGGADDRAFQAGERVAGVVVVEDQHRGGPGYPGRHIPREAGDPLDAVHPHLPADRSGQRNDA